MLVRDLILLFWTSVCTIMGIITYAEHGNEATESLLSIIMSIPVALILLVIPELFFPNSDLAKTFQVKLFK